MATHLPGSVAFVFQTPLPDRTNARYHGITGSSALCCVVSSVKRSRRAAGHRVFSASLIQPCRLNADRSIFFNGSPKLVRQLKRCVENLRTVLRVEAVHDSARQKASVSANDSSLWNSVLKFARRNIINRIADLRFAIGLLLLIAALSSLGTFVNQNETTEFYIEHYPLDPAIFGFLTYKVILGLGLNHVYSTPWFLSLLTVLGASLTTCTFTNQIPTLNTARKRDFMTSPKSFSRLAVNRVIPGGDIALARKLVEERGYKIFTGGLDKLYGDSGIIGKIGPIIVHASMILVLLGSSVAALVGWQAQEMIPQGYGFHITNVYSAGPLAEPLVPKDMEILVNRFWIDYNNDGSVSQFHSDLSFMDKEGRELYRDEAYVNHPVKYKGVTFYQTSWGLAGLKVRINDSPEFMIPMAKLDVSGDDQLWGTFIPINTELTKGISVLAKDFNNLIIYDADGNFNQVARPGSTARQPVEGLTLHFGELVGATGLQIKSDPGIPFIFTGFGFLIVSTFVSFISHKQVWLHQSADGKLYIGGKANKAKYDFEEEMRVIVRALEKDARSRVGPAATPTIKRKGLQPTA